MDLAFLGIYSEIGFDMGSGNTLVNVKGKGLIPSEPSVVAMDTLNKKVIVAGRDADEMLGRTPDNIQAVCPVREGVISDFEATSEMIRYFLKKAVGKKMFVKPKVVATVPISITEVERRATIEAFGAAGAGTVILIEGPLAAAMGAGIDIKEARGNMIVDLGAGTVDAAVLSLGAIVSCKSIRIGGDTINERIISYMRRKYQVTIGEKTAEEIKKEIGSASAKLAEGTYDVRGRETGAGLPKNVRVSALEIHQAISGVVGDIVGAVLETLENTPPELAADVLASGITLTGGCANLKGIDSVIESVTGIKTRIADNKEECAALGTLEVLSNPEIIRRSFVAKSR